jgi:ubiquinone/menaquinone biosynthesis C-methylase UbiE
VDTFLGVVLLIGGLIGVGYYLFVTTEGVFLGRWVVVKLYDEVAGRYDALKQFDPDYEEAFLARPLLLRLADMPQPHILDVATGTGRVPALLLGQAGFRGRVTALDASPRMLAQAEAKLAPYGDRVTLVHHAAAPLPFPDATFDAVTCMEALEFLPSDAAALQEMVRVLKPDGLLLTTRRRDWEGKAFLHRYRSRDNLADLLRSLGLIHVEIVIWQVGYDQVWAVKPGEGVSAEA